MRLNYLFFVCVSVMAACGGGTDIPQPDGPPSTPDSPAACPAATGPTHHSASINADETWTAAGSPHVVDNGFSINATLTLEACAQVQIASNATITAGFGGSIVGEGTADRPITIGAIDSTKPWAQIRA